MSDDKQKKPGRPINHDYMQALAERMANDYPQPDWREQPTGFNIDSAADDLMEGERNHGFDY